MSQRTIVEKYPSGAPKTKTQVVIVDGYRSVPHGSFQSWFEGGQRDESGGYHMGLKDGRWLRWWDTGHVRRDAYYEQGELNGIVLMWDREHTELDVNYFAGGEFQFGTTVVLSKRSELKSVICMARDMDPMGFTLSLTEDGMYKSSELI